MIIDLVDTDASRIDQALTDARHRSGAAATGMVMTLVIATDEASHYDAMRAANEAAKEHPSRILVVVQRPSDDHPRLDAEIRVGGESGPGDLVLLRLYGALGRHADSVVLPLLLPDAPVVVWWPTACPEAPCQDPLGALAQRRITDVAAGPDPLDALRRRARGYCPGDTDLAWTRITAWRTILAAALDRCGERVEAAEVAARADSPSAELLAAWLGRALSVPVTRTASPGPGITAVHLRTATGEVALTRPDGRVATLASPGEPDRMVTLRQRPLAELMAEELRRLDPDEVYAEAAHTVAANAGAPSPAGAS